MTTTTGWICPKCGRVYGPNATECGPCNLHIQLYGPGRSGPTPSTLGGNYEAQSLVGDPLGEESPQSKGGHARAASLSPERRQEIARAAANKRWNL